MPTFGLSISDSGIFQLQVNQFLFDFDQRQCGFDQSVLHGFPVTAGFEQTGQTFPNTCEHMQRVQFRLVLLFRNMLNLIDKPIIHGIETFTLRFGKVLVDLHVQQGHKVAFFKFSDPFRHKYQLLLNDTKSPGDIWF